MSRPKGSKNKSTEELEKLQQKVNDLEKQYSSYDEVVSAFIDGCILDVKESVKTISLNTLQTWFNNPDSYMENISNLLSYYYIIDGNIMQLYDLVFSLPQLDYKITAYKKTKTYSNDMIKIKQMLDKKIKHKQLTRDLLIQLVHDGTLIGTWLGNNKNPYFYVFDNLKYIYPYGRYKGEMVAIIDLKWLDEMKEEQREAIYNDLSPLITRSKYDKWKNETNSEKKKKKQYIILPSDKTLVARTHTLNRNQRLGIPHGTQALFDILHKTKMKELERSIADKIIRAVAVVKFKGKDDNDNRVREKDRKKVFSGVKKALELNTNATKSSITVLGMPDFASMEMPEFKNGDKILSPDKYENATFDITNSTGVPSVLTNGMKGNFSSAKASLDILYKKIGVLLEQIEEIYNQLIVILLGETKGLNYTFIYNKETPIEKTKRIDTLMKLEAQGYSASYVLDELGINSEEFFEQSIYEIETLKLRDKIKPPQLDSTQSGSDNEGGRTPIDNPDNDNTIKSKEQNEE